MSKGRELETTWYRFYSEVRVFLSKLIKNPITAEPNKYLKDREFTKKKLIDVLMDKDVLERSEKILDSTNSDRKKPTYSVTYKVRKKDFEKRVHRIYSKYFEKNLPEKPQEEIDESTSCGFVGGANGMEYDVLINGGTPIRRSIYECDGGKTESKSKSAGRKRIRITSDQFKLIQETINAVTNGDLDEATTTSNIGAMGDYTANGLVLKTADGKRDPSYDR